MSLSVTEMKRVVDAANGIALNAATVPVEHFFARTLKMTTTEVGELFSATALEGSALISLLTREREEALRDRGSIPPFIVYKSSDVGSGYSLSGLSTYLAEKGKLADHPANFLERLKRHNQIRTALIEIDDGHHLELVAAALLEQACSAAEATKGSGDQGVDAIAWKTLVHIEDAFLDGEIKTDVTRAGRNVVIIASSKASLRGVSLDPKLKIINPAHIRELVGSWIIQRSEVGAWRQLGIQMLTPLQLVLVTTYRLSEDAKAECRDLGIQVWGIPELVYLTCRYAPDSVFYQNRGAVAFGKRPFRQWWGAKDAKRLGH